jgi:hypothetical protein
MKRILIAVCVALGIVAFSASEAQAIAIQFDTKNVTGDVWQYDYFITGFSFDDSQALLIDFDSYLYADLQDTPPPPNADWSTQTFPTSVPTPGVVGDLVPGSFVAVPLVNGASLADPFTVTFTWLGTGTPGSQAFTVYDADFVPIVTGQTSPVPEPATLGLMAIGIAVASGWSRSSANSATSRVTP